MLAAALFQGVQPLAVGDVGNDADGWDTVKGPSQLLTDLTQATPDIFRTRRSAGAASVRGLVHGPFPGEQRSRQFFQSEFTDAAFINEGLAWGKASCEASDMTSLSTEKLAGKAKGGRKGSATAQPKAHA